MKNLKIFIAVIGLFTMTSCARSCQELEKSILDNHSHRISITKYSCNGDTIRQWVINGIINNEENSDGYYFYHENKLVTVSGDIVIEYLD